MNKDELLRLCERVRENDPEALEQLYEYCYLPLFRYCFALTLQKEDAEDLTHEAFIKAARNIKKLRHSNLLGWLFTIARNEYIDAKRKNKKLQPLDDEFDKDIEKQELITEQNFGTLEFSVVSEKDVATFLDKLRPAEREVIVLKYWQELNAAEIAKVTGKSHSAVRKILSRAMASLKKIIDSHVKNEF